MKTWIMGLAWASMLSCIALCLTPGGRVRSVVKMVCGVMMALALVKPVLELDLSAYSMNLAAYRERAHEIESSASRERERLSRMIIEEECAAYIWDKAQVFLVELTAVEVTAKWGDRGYWYPYEVYLEVNDGQSGRMESLQSAIEGDLGIPLKRQQWRIAYEDDGASGENQGNAEE